MDSKRLLVLVQAYGIACAHSQAAFSTGNKGLRGYLEWERELWRRICSALGEQPGCLFGLCDDDLDPDHPFNDDGEQT